jgi:hypothetical protein
MKKLPVWMDILEQLVDEVEKEKEKERSRRTRAMTELSEGARADIEAFAKKYSDMIEDADALPQPLRHIAKFVKAVVDGKI